MGERRNLSTMMAVAVLVAILGVVLVALPGCGAREPGGAASQSAGAEGTAAGPTVIAETSFLADIAQNVAGDRLRVTSILPLGVDPHSFDPTPQHAARIAQADAVIVNSPGFEPPIDHLIAGAGSKDLLVIDASAGLPGAESDPHFWLDPTMVLTYVDNIRAGLERIDPAGAGVFAENAAAYRQRIKGLDSWIVEQVATLPVSHRLLVTNHESFGRFAARYDFTVVGAILPSAETDAAPSAEGLAALVKAIKTSGAPAIFVETGNNRALAEQLARETGVKVVDDLYTHSLGPQADSYIAMMHWNVEHIVEALR